MYGQSYQAVLCYKVYSGDMYSVYTGGCNECKDTEASGPLT